MRNSTQTTLAVVLTVLVCSLAAAPAAVAADEDTDTDEDDSIVPDRDEIEATLSTWYDAFRGTTLGLYDRMGYEAGAINPLNEGPDLETEANETVAAINDHNESVDGVGVLLEPDSDEAEVHEVTLADKSNDAEERFYVHLESHAGEYIGVEATHDIDESTSIEDGREHELSGYLATQASDEIDELLDRAAADELDDARYQAELTAKYGGIFESQIESPLLDEIELPDGGDES